MIKEQGLETILIVEDEQDIAEIIAFNLEQAGYHTQTARTGEDALVKVGKFLPDLVILDLMLPGIDGLEICKKFKQDPVLLHIPVLIVTAKSEDNDIICGLEMGADDYITKPFSPRILTARVKTILRRTKIRVDNKQQGSLSLHGIEIDVNPAFSYPESRMGFLPGAVNLCCSWRKLPGYRPFH